MLTEEKLTKAEIILAAMGVALIRHANGTASMSKGRSSLTVRTDKALALAVAEVVAGFLS